MQRSKYPWHVPFQNICEDDSHLVDSDCRVVDAIYAVNDVQRKGALLQAKTEREKPEKSGFFVLPKKIPY